MTKQRNNLVTCDNCGHEYDPSNPFSTYVRQFTDKNDPRSSSFVVIGDVDNYAFRYQLADGTFCTLEIKTFGKRPDKSQMDAQNIMTQMLQIASGVPVETLRGRRPIHFIGHYVVIYEKSNEDDSAWIEINGKKYIGDGKKQALDNILKTCHPDGIKTLPTLKRFELSVMWWMSTLSVSRALKWINHLTGMLSSKDEAA